MFVYVTVYLRHYTHTQMERTDQKEDTLIDFWEQHPCLYDISSKSYSNRNEKQKATNEIAEKLCTTAVNISKRLTSLY